MQSEAHVKTDEAAVLRAAFLAGAILDAGALLPMLVRTVITGMAFGGLSASRLLPTWCLQGLLLLWFAWAYQRSGRTAVRR